MIARISTRVARRTLFTANSNGNKTVFDYSKLTNDQLYPQLNKLKAELPREEYLAIEERVLAPYRVKNRAMGAGLVTFCGLVFAYAAFRTKTEDFRNIEPLAVKKE
ncbi:UNVERIFIED_CONTAM: hypothetical protein HDU68_005225 [Siphonaria sp. JEL0065]|nr:hypothetical protein HDU68_005225 [Siphonaria sp. JEL0065]